MSQYLDRIILAAKEKLPKKVGKISLIQGVLEGSTPIKTKKLFTDQKYPTKVVVNLIEDLKSVRLNPAKISFFQHDFHVEGIVYFGLTFSIPKNDILNLQLPNALKRIGERLVHKRLVPEIFWELRSEGDLFITLFLKPPVQDVKRESEREATRKDAEKAQAFMTQVTAPFQKYFGMFDSQSRFATVWRIPKGKKILPHKDAVALLEKDGWKSDTQVSDKKESKTIFTKKIGKEVITLIMHRKVEKETTDIDIVNHTEEQQHIHH